MKLKTYFNNEKILWRKIGGAGGVNLRAMEGTIITDIRHIMQHKRVHNMDLQHFKDRLRKKYKR